MMGIDPIKKVAQGKKGVCVFVVLESKCINFSEFNTFINTQDKLRSPKLAHKIYV